MNEREVVEHILNLVSHVKRNGERHGDDELLGPNEKVINQGVEILRQYNPSEPVPGVHRVQGGVYTFELTAQDTAGPIVTVPPLATYQEWAASHACKVCQNVPDEDGYLQHGRGCYVIDSDGGGTDYIRPPLFAPDAQRK